MDRSMIARVLDAWPSGAFWIDAVQVLDWGARLVFDCRYQPDGTDKMMTFQLVLNDCRDLRWRVYAHSGGSGPVTLVDIRLGTDQHRKPANILTDSFGLTVLYGSQEVKSSEKPSKVPRAE
ncbi:MAG: hypothetical protein K8I60_04480 [Anaerolineae bacterium]|nr:hypothetical protein [Anaerolineae bacterium]